MVDDLTDSRRIEPNFLLPERQMLDAWLDFHRMTLLLKCEGLDNHSRRSRPANGSQSRPPLPVDRILPASLGYVPARPRRGRTTARSARVEVLVDGGCDELGSAQQCSVALSGQDPGVGATEGRL